MRIIHKYITIILILLTSNSVYADWDPDQIELEKLGEILEQINESYVDTTDSYVLMEAAIKGMLQELDPHSVYFSKEKMTKVNEGLRGNFSGIGVRTYIIDDTVHISDLTKNGPCQLAGLKPGDKIISVDYKSIVGKTRSEVSKRFRGKNGSDVSLQILRFGNPEKVTFFVTRGRIPLNSVVACFLFDSSDVGYVRINRFMAKTHKEFVDSVSKLKRMGMKKLIIDLHGNPGGYLSQAVRIVDEFLPEGNLIVSTKGRSASSSRADYSTLRDKFIGLPVILLADKWSASGSEIMLGAFQDLDRGIIIGETTYGKGLVQRQYPLEDSTGFRITISKYFTPSGRCIQRAYEDKAKYRKFEGRIKLEDGGSLDDLLAKIKSDLGEEHLPPLFETKSGRTVVGGGGITPDYIVKYDTLSAFGKKIRNKKIPYLMAHKLINDNQDFFSEFDDDYKKFENGFIIDNEMYEDFKEIATTQGIEWDDNEFEDVKKYFSYYVKSELSRIKWGDNEFYKVFLPYYRQIPKALELFPEAEDLAKVK